MASAWWLFDNYMGGIHVAFGRNVVEAKADARERIGEAFAAEGLSPAACRRAAQSYRLRVVAGPIGREAALEARTAWQREDWALALTDARPHIRAAFGLARRHGGGAVEHV